MKTELQKELSEGRFGLEKEGLRVDKHTHLVSVTDHPFGSDPHITRDFCEAQVEIVTPVCQDTDELFRTLHELDGHVKEVLAKRGEMLWNHSNPPAGYDAKKIRVAHFEGKEKEKEVYRNYLKEKYGIDIMLLSGIHFNFSFTERALAALFSMSASGIPASDIPASGASASVTSASGLPGKRAGNGGHQESKCGQSSGKKASCAARPCIPRSFSDNLYLRLAAKAMRYAWFITYLTAASPVTAFHGNIPGYFHGNSWEFGKEYDAASQKSMYVGPGGAASQKAGDAQPEGAASQKVRDEKPQGIASLRCSEYGYWNDFIPTLDYSSGLDAYVDSIKALVDEGKLYSAWELYLPVRLKPCGYNALENLRAGISHIELRMLDINPLAPDGIQKEDIDFLHDLLIMWAVQDAQNEGCSEADRFGADAQRRAVRNMQRASLLDADSIRIEDAEGHFLPVRTAALDLLAEMERFYEPWQAPRILSLIRFERRKVLHSGERYAERVLRECADCTNSGLHD